MEVVTIKVRAKKNKKLYTFRFVADELPENWKEFFLEQIALVMDFFPVDSDKIERRMVDYYMPNTLLFRDLLPTFHEKLYSEMNNPH